MRSRATRTNADLQSPAVAPDYAANVLAALPFPVLVTTADGAIVEANGAAETFFDTSAASLRRSLVGDLIAPGSALLADLFEHAGRGRTLNKYGVELHLVRWGSKRLVDVFASPCNDPERRLVLTFVERSVPAMIERQLSHKVASRSITGLASMLAHEIKNPLSGIRGAAQLIEATVDEDARRLTQLICRETDRICRIVDNMEDFGDARPIAKTPVNVHSVLDHVKQIAVQGFGQGIKISERYDPSLPPVPGSADRLTQAFLNLVKNAAEALQSHTARDARIVLSTSFRPGLRQASSGTGAGTSLPLIVAIEDNGPGVPQDIRPHLFDPFVTSKPGGRGLGLALVAKIVEQHGGLIELDQLPGRTMFRVALPIVSEAS